jgi:ribosomal protein L1
MLKSPPSEVNMLVNRFETDKASIETQLRKAVSAIQKYATKKAEQVAAETGALDLLPEPESVILGLTINHIPAKKEFRFNMVPVPHPVLDLENKSVCLLARDPKENATEAVAKEALPIEKIITVKSLKRKYQGVDSRRELMKRFDFFFCEHQIYEVMPKLLGKNFFEHNKAKIPIALKSLKKGCFEAAIRTARFRVRGGSLVGVKIGHRGMTVDALVENAMAVIEFFATKYCTNPKTTNNVYGIHIGASNLIDLPVWSVPVRAEEPSEEKAVPVETPQKKAKKVVEEAPQPSLASADIATLPVKKLKQVQKHRLEEAKTQLSASSGPKKTKRS